MMDGVAAQALARVEIGSLERDSPELSVKFRRGASIFCAAVPRVLEKALVDLPESMVSVLAEDPQKNLLALLYGTSLKVARDVSAGYGMRAPYELRLIVAICCQVLWDDMQAHEIDFEVERPKVIADLMQVAHDSRLHMRNQASLEDSQPSASRSLLKPEWARALDTGGAGREASESASLSRSEHDLESIALDALSHVHEEMGLISLPVSYSVGILQALLQMSAAALLHRTGDADGFKMVIGSMSKSLNKRQRKMLGYSFLNNYPEKAVLYVKAIVSAAAESGAFDDSIYSPEYVKLISNKPPGS